MLTRRGLSTGTCRWTRRSRAHQHATNTTRPDQDKGVSSNHKNLPLDEVEPDGHGIGRSRGGLTTKIHHTVDGRGLPLAVVVTGRQRNDGAVQQQVLDNIRVPRVGSGRPRTRPDSVAADKAYASGVNRRMLRARGIRAVIPGKSDQIATRKRKGSTGGKAARVRRGSLLQGPQRRRTVLRARSSNGEASRPATTNSQSPTASAPSSTPASPEQPYWETPPSSTTTRSTTPATCTTRSG